MVTKKYLVNSNGDNLEKAALGAEEFAAQVKLDERQKLQMRLLVEETLGMVKAMVESFDGELWLSSDDVGCTIHLQATTPMNTDKKQELLSVSSSGKNASAKGFMGKIGEFISRTLYNYDKAAEAIGFSPIHFGIIGSVGSDTLAAMEMTPVWTLAQYRNDLIENKNGDPTATEAWDELEKSIVASLADDVIVGVRGNEIELAIVKKFWQNDATEAREVQTDKLLVNNVRARVQAATELAERFGWDAGLSPRASMHLHLLVEETLGMVRSMTDRFEGQLWLEGGRRAARIHLQANTLMDAEKKRQLIAAASSGKNAAPMGFMAKLGEMIADAFPIEDDGGFADYLYDDLPDFITFGSVAPLHERAAIHSWSMANYRSALQQEVAKDHKAADALDELEKSIVARLADDVTVSVKGNQVEMVILKNFHD